MSWQEPTLSRGVESREGAQHGRNSAGNWMHGVLRHGGVGRNFSAQETKKKKIHNDSFGMNCTANSGKKKVMRNDRGRTSGGCWGKDLFIYLL